MAECFIFCAGTLYGMPVKPKEGDFIIAADAGYEAAKACGIKPQLVIGDFDSCQMPEGEETLSYPVKKDDTDSALAVKEGLKRGYRVFHLYGGTGGKRLDHTLANFQLLMWICKQGAVGYLYDDGFIYRAIENESLIIHKTKDWGIVSVFCLGADAKGVTIKGLEYPLTNGILQSSLPLAVSNHFQDEMGTITVEDGMLVIGWEI